MTAKKEDAVAVIDPTKYAVTLPQGREDLTMLLGGGVGVFDMTRMKVPGSGGRSWEIETLKGVEAFPTVEGVIMLVQGNQKSWWRDPYGSGGGNTPPNCSSVNGRLGRGNPSMKPPTEDEEDVQGEHNCIACPWNQWKSAKDSAGKQANGKACKDFAMIFLYREGSRTPTMLTVSPTSLKGMRRYSVVLMDAGKRVSGVVTRLGLNPTQNATGTQYSEITFEYVGDLPDDAAAEVEETSAIMADFLATNTITLDPSDLHGGGD